MATIETVARELIAAVEQHDGHSPYCGIFFRNSAEDGYKGSYCTCIRKKMADAASKLRRVIETTKT